MITFALYYDHQQKLKLLKYQVPFDPFLEGFEQNPSNFNSPAVQVKNTLSKSQETQGLVSIKGSYAASLL